MLIHERATRRMIRLATASGVAVAGMLAVLSVLAAAFSHDHDESVHELVVAADFHRDLDAVLQLIVDGETAQRGYVLTADPVFLTPLLVARRELPEKLNEVVAQLGERHGEGLADELAEALRARTDFTEDVVAMVSAGDQDAARAQIAAGEGRIRMDRVRRLIADAHAHEDDDVAEILTAAETSRRRALAAIAALMLVSMLTGLGLAWSLRGHVRRGRLLLKRGAEEARRFRMLAERASDLVRIYRMDGVIEYASPSSEPLLGYTAAELLTLPNEALYEPEEGRRVRAMVDQALAAGAVPPPIRHHLRRKDKVTRIFETRVELAVDPDPSLSRFHMVSRDVTAEVEEQRHLGLLASRDDMTGLLNRRAWIETGEELLAQAGRSGKGVLVCFCDVNGLKVVNDSLGHSTGDELLRDAAELIRSTAGPADLVARRGGDEFVVLAVLDGDDGEAGFRERLGAALQAHNDAAGRRYRVSMSLGSAVRRPEESLEELLARADAAMYLDKQERRGEITGSRIVRECSTTGSVE